MSLEPMPGFLHSISYDSARASLSPFFSNIFTVHPQTFRHSRLSCFLCPTSLLRSSSVCTHPTTIHSEMTEKMLLLSDRTSEHGKKEDDSLHVDIKLNDAQPSVSEWKRKSMVTLALTILTSSQGILIAWSKRAGGYDYSVTTANFMVELLKCLISLGSLIQIWRRHGVNEDNKLSMSWEEVKVYPIPAGLYLIKNLLQYYVFLFVDAPSYQILKNLNIITTGILYKLFLQRRLTAIQWAAYALLALGCTTAQLNASSEHVLQTPFEGWALAIIMALLSGFAGVYTEVIIKKRPSRNINVQNFWLYVFGIIFNSIAIFTQDFDAVIEKGFFHGYTVVTICMIVNHALSGIAVSMVMKYADNIVKVYSTSVAMLLTAVVSMMLFHFKLTLPFVLGSSVVSIAVYLHSHGKAGK